MTEHQSHVHPQAHDHTHDHGPGHGHAPARSAPTRGPVARASVAVDAEPVSWLMHSGTQRLLAALLVIAAVLAAMAWAISAQG